MWISNLNFNSQIQISLSLLFLLLLLLFLFLLLFLLLFWLWYWFASLLLIFISYVSTYAHLTIFFFAMSKHKFSLWVCLLLNSNLLFSLYINTGVGTLPSVSMLPMPDKLLLFSLQYLYLYGQCKNITVKTGEKLTKAATRWQE